MYYLKARREVRTTLLNNTREKSKTCKVSTEWLIQRTFKAYYSTAILNDANLSAGDQATFLSFSTARKDTTNLSFESQAKICNGFPLPMELKRQLPYPVVLSSSQHSLKSTFYPLCPLLP